MMNRIFVFTIILFCLSSCSSSQKVTTEQAVAEGYAPKGSIRDMVLIYDGELTEEKYGMRNCFSHTFMLLVKMLKEVIGCLMVSFFWKSLMAIVADLLPVIVQPLLQKRIGLC